jgi:hypothetical protein
VGARLGRIAVGLLLISLLSLALDYKSLSAQTSSHTSDRSIGRKFLSRAYTVRDMAVDRLYDKAQKWAKLVGEKSPTNYRPARIYDYESPPNADVGIDRRSGATVAIFSTAVTSVDDPWKEVCRESLEGMVSWLFGLKPGKPLDVWALVTPDFGHLGRTHPDSARAAARELLQNVNATWMFVYVETGRVLSCAYASSSGKITYSDTTMALP